MSLFAALLLLAASGARAGAVPSDYALLDGARAGRYLRYDMRGPEVAALQSALAATGRNVSATGYFGPVTLSCVRDLQRASGLGVDGVVGPRTVEALDRALGLSGGAPSGPSTGGGTSGGGASSGGGAVPGSASSLALPARPQGAETGAQLLARTASEGRAGREAEIQRALLSGNVPASLRGLREVRYAATDTALRPHVVAIQVLPDYLAIGSDQDFVRIPVSPITAQRVADAAGASLPTRKLVNEIYAAADVKLAPLPLTPGPQMMSNAYTAEHHRRIEAQRGAQPLGALTAGHKKDVVLSQQLASRPGRVAIYGWHMLSGRPIQPLSTVHEAAYSDYSHGARLVHATITVDGRAVRLADVLQDPVLWPLVSDEGRMSVVRIPGA